MNYKGFFLSILLLSACSRGLVSEYKGGITQQTLVGATWQQINTDFNGTYIMWHFLNDTQIANFLRGAVLYYQWEPYELTGTVTPNPENQAIFKLTSTSPGGTLYQYMIVWFINAAGTTAVFQIYTSPEDITRFLVNEHRVISSPNYKRVD